MDRATVPGSASHLGGELFNDRAGIEMVHVPYKGGAPALQDLLGGRIAAYFSAPPTAMRHHGLRPQPTTRAEFAAFMKKESTQWAATIQARKITAN